MNKALNKIKPQVRALSAYTLKETKYEVKINQNENPFEIPDNLKEEVMTAARKRPWRRYPDFVQTRFAQKLAHHVGWPSEGILMGNGSNELIQALLMVTLGPGGRVVIPTPTFTLYQLLSHILGAEVIEVPLRESDYAFDVPAIERTILRTSADMVIICSPNNPTGGVMAPEDVERILRGTDALVVVDEAYQQFSDSTCFPLLKQYENLIVLRTFSKACSLAGLRIGYLMAHPEVAAEIAKAKLPYNLNFFSEEAAIKILDHWAVVQAHVDILNAQREVVYERLKKMDGVTVYPSQANFLLFETPFEPGQIFDRLVDRGILIRDVSKYPMLPKALRVSIGSAEENRRFIEGMERILQELSTDVDRA
ncbi:MAG: histidinol-phosphate transaminase [Candidatus Latescibacterota bacterium]